MEGLEISEVMLSYVLNKNDVFRFDSNFFQKNFLLEEEVIRNKEHKTLQNSGVGLRSFGAYSLNNEVTYLDNGIPFIRGVNMKKGRISFSDMIFIDDRANSLLWKSEVKPETILLSMSGTIGDVAIASKHWNYPMNSNQDIAKIDTRGNINPYFLYAFFMSRFGQNYLKREARGSVQQHVFLSQIDQFEVPVFSSVFEKQIQETIEKSDDLLFRSESLYAQSQTLLLEDLGMANFSPSREAVNVKSYKDSFLSSGRLDAEYYQPKYEQIVKKIESNNHARLVDLVSIKKSIEPGSDVYTDEGTLFLRVSDYNKFGYTTPEKKLSNEFCNKNAALLAKLKPKKDTILFSKDGSVGIAYKVVKDEEFITSGAVLHLRVKDKTKMLPDYLTLALNSNLVQMQAERDAGGSIILHWRVGEIENVVVPVLNYNEQERIAALVQESFELKTQSEALLEIAKRGVEKAIETDESTANKWIIDECRRKNLIL